MHEIRSCDTLLNLVSNHLITKSVMKKLVLILLSLTAFCFAANAAKGQCGSHVYWVLTDSVLTLTGEGKTWEYDGKYDISPFVEYKDEIRDVVIGDNITRLGNSLFSGLTTIRNVSFNNELQEIGTKAFWGCTSLKEVVFPDSLKIITAVSAQEKKQGKSHPDYGDSFDLSTVYGSFAGCTSLEKVTFGTGLKEVGYQSFFRCSNLTELDWKAGDVDFPDYWEQGRFGSVYKYENCSFTWTKLTTVNFSDSVSYIPAYLFCEIPTLTNISFGKGIKEVGCHAFGKTAWQDNQPYGMIYVGPCAYYYRCKEGENSTSNLDIKEGTTVISKGALSGVGYYSDNAQKEKLVSLSLPTTLEKVYYDLADFSYSMDTIRWNCRNAVIEMRMENPTHSQVYPFQSQKNAKIIIGEEVEKIPEYFLTFTYTPREITLPPSVTEIGENAFYYAGLTALNFSDTPVSIGSLYGNPLDTLHLKALTSEIILNGIDTKYLIVGENMKYPVIFQTLDSLETLDWYAKKIESSEAISGTYLDNHSSSTKGELMVNVQEGVEEIPENFLRGLKKKVTVSLPSTLKKIRENAFYNLSQLKDIKLPDGLEYIQTAAFYGSGLSEIFVPASVKFVSRSAFENIPLDQAIFASPEAPLKDARVGYYAQAALAPKVYVPDMDSYKDWQPAPNPMAEGLEGDKYIVVDGVAPTIKLKSLIPGYTVSTDFTVSHTTEGTYTEKVPVTFQGPRDFSTEINYTYTILPESGIDMVESDSVRIYAENGKIMVNGYNGTVEVYNPAGNCIYNGEVRENGILLQPGLYIVKAGMTIKKVAVAD